MSQSCNELDLKIGDCVLLNKTIGIVLYIGSVEWDISLNEDYVGIELVSPIDNGNNGMINNKRYFDCKPKHGVLLPISSVIRKIKPRELIHRLTEYKHKIKQAQHLKYNLTKSLQVNSTQDDPKELQGKNVKIEGKIALKQDNDDCYMMLKNKASNILDNYSIKINQNCIHHTSSMHTNTNSDINVKHIKLVDVANYWLNIFNLRELKVSKNTSDIFDKLEKLTKLNVSNYDEITEISNIISCFKHLYEEWYIINDVNNYFTDKCNGEIIKCKCIHRIIVQLKVYQKFIDDRLLKQKDIYSNCTLFEILNSFLGYSRELLLEDWDHINKLHLFEQQDSMEFIDWTLEKQETFNYFEEKLLSSDICNNVDNCPAFDRPHQKCYDRNFYLKKMDIYKIPNKWKNNQNNMIDKEMIIQDQFDIIHNKILHSSAKYEALGKYDSVEHLGIKKLIKTKKNKWLSMFDSLQQQNINNTPKTIISFNHYSTTKELEQETKSETYDKQYIINKYGKLPSKIPIELDDFDRWNYFKYWFSKNGTKIEYAQQLKTMDNKHSKQIIENDASLKKISELIPIYCKWHFFMQSSTNYDFLDNYPCDIYCKKQPCKFILRISVLMEFFNKWIKDTINMKTVEIKTEKYHSCGQFLQSLDMYDINQFTKDLNHLYQFHLSPNDERFNHLLFCNWKKERVSIYQYFINKLGKCDIKECGIFERYIITKYDDDYFEENKSDLFAIKPDLIDTEIEKREISLQQKLDECHVKIWHSKKKYSTLKLLDTEQYKHFNELMNEWKDCV